MDVFPRYQNKEIKATKDAATELWEFGKDLWDVLDILEKGYPCGGSKRGPGVREQCVQKGDKIHKAVVVDCGRYWLVIHYGVFSYKRR